MTRQFLNPYTFIPAFPRRDLPAWLKDSPPPPHNQLRSYAWTGRIGVTLTVETPLLLLDTPRSHPPTKGEGDHKVYPVHLRNGRPHLSPTSIKGMLRAAYEAITNSRFGIFDRHDTSLVRPRRNAKGQGHTDERNDVIPAEFLDCSLRPADEYGKLSPADRVFGWVAPNGTGVQPAAYRGRLRIGPVTCDGDRSAVREFDGDGLPLAILGQPKPKQARFYLSESPEAPEKPIRAGTPARELYRKGRGLRGRKVYWHHAGLDAERHWGPTGPGDPTQKPVGGRYREYRRPYKPVDDEGTLFQNLFYKTRPGEEQRDTQNRSIKGWVRPGTVFRFTIDVRDLDKYELGALAWLLTLPEGHFHRLGLGRPLGFGSVRLEIDAERTELHSGDQYKAYYRTLLGELPKEDGLKTLHEAREKFVQDAPSQLRQIHEAFLVVARGNPGLPVHYPRTYQPGLSAKVPAPPDPRGRNFEWFTENERVEKGRIAPGRGRSLPGPLDTSPALEVYPAKGERRPGGKGNGQGRSGVRRRG